MLRATSILRSRKACRRAGEAKLDGSGSSAMSWFSRWPATSVEDDGEGGFVGSGRTAINGDFAKKASNA